MALRLGALFLLIVFGSAFVIYSYALQRPDIDKHLIERTIRDRTVKSWRFAAKEKRKIQIIETKYDGDKATVVIDMKTSAPAVNIFGARTKQKIKMEGRLRLHYEWIAKSWTLMRLESLTFKRKTG